MTSLSYTDFLQSKLQRVPASGFDVSESDINPKLFAWQKKIVQWSLKRGKAAIFADCGLGKSAMQLEWANQVCQHTQGNALVLAPLAVASQTVQEGRKFGIEATLCHGQSDVKPGINITNYEKIHKFGINQFVGIILDESSCLKSYDSHYRKLLTEFAANIPYRLACTATPAPNDYMELGNHAEFLSVMNRLEMLAMFFTHDGGDTSKWRLKGHARREFWRWLASWAVAIRKPSDIGFEDGAFVLPPLNIQQISVEIASSRLETLFPVEANTLEERRRARRESLEDRVRACAELVNASDGSWLVWCDLNAESEALTKSIKNAVEVKGSDSNEHKEQSMLRFAAGEIRVLVTKPSLAGFGMNFQQCHNMAFVGLSDSYEQQYQAIRRCWRFGQKHAVNVWMIAASTEGAVVRNLQRKEEQAKEMFQELVEEMKDFSEVQRQDTKREVDYETDVAKGDCWELYLGDSCEVLKSIKSDSIHYSIFSPPFSNLYVYSQSSRDLGNVRNYDEFSQHFQFLIKELYRVIKPGRLLSFHCMNLPISKQMEGYIGIRDFRGDLIRMFQAEGFIFHSEVCIWKDPVVAMQRTKAIGLLYKQLKKDSALSRQGIPDYLVTMRKPGDNSEPITKDPKEFPVQLWQRYASPVWMDINPSKTLQKESARENDDERHICPLQLEVIERAIALWTNEGDVVLDPFNGIGSTGYVALKCSRRYVGVELKPSYWRVAVNNLRAISNNSQMELFDKELMEVVT